MTCCGSGERTPQESDFPRQPSPRTPLPHPLGFGTVSGRGLLSLRLQGEVGPRRHRQTRSGAGVPFPSPFMGPGLVAAHRVPAGARRLRRFRAEAVDPRPMLIRMVHVRPSLGPIPSASPTPHAHSRALRWPPCFGGHLPFRHAVLIRAARRPGADAKLAALAPTETRSRVARDRDRPGHVSHDHRAGRAPTLGALPFIPRPPPALEATPRDSITRCA